MNNCSLSLAGADLVALGSGALWWPAERLLCVSDLHLGKSERIARRGGTILPPYETRDTLLRLTDDLDRMNPATVICLGDSFDDLDAARALAPEDQTTLTRMQAGRRWIWIEGNHDSGPVDLGGTHLADLTLGPLTFRHIAQTGARGEISGHYHPKASLTTRARRITRAAFLSDRDRIIMPAYGTYTGGLRSHDATLTALMRPDALAILTGPRAYAVPMPR
ncbi:ligase-associated DNA damage response endonuclease PdeM [Heliomarina baculiformis]|uniref:ligase-associated DNA damage response endonuclease PdeM n=1 Tax=Heliomarina baculiformis TaxID=2872036 RepID=UPI001EE27A24|nr:ligase-associated DNA damage response endonuclease PdeM [Heliomarina baculiformis]